MKIAYPSNATDMKGLKKAAFYDGNPVVMLEQKFLRKLKFSSRFKDSIVRRIGYD